MGTNERTRARAVTRVNPPNPEQYVLRPATQLERAIEAAAVIGGKLGDDLGRLVGANNPPSNSNRLFH